MGTLGFFPRTTYSLLDEVRTLHAEPFSPTVRARWMVLLTLAERATREARWEAGGVPAAYLLEQSDPRGYARLAGELNRKPGDPGLADFAGWALREYPINGSERDELAATLARYVHEIENPPTPLRFSLDHPDPLLRLHPY